MKPIRPMLAVEGVSEVEAALAGMDHKIPFPCIAQPKFDGFRCIIPSGTPMTRTLKPISNGYVRSRLESLWDFARFEKFGEGDNHPLNGMDGELIAVDPEDYSELDLHLTQSLINSASGAPRFVYHVFDDFSSPDLPYTKRQMNLNLRLEQIRNYVSEATLETNPERLSPRIHPHVFMSVESRICKRIEDVLEFESEILRYGGEGIMLRRPDAKYKFGRSTLNEFACIKVKRFSADTATITGLIELMINDNEATTDERGYTKRSSHKANKRPSGRLGTMTLDWNGTEFELGTGWDHAFAHEVWENQSSYIGKKVDFKYKGTGPNGRPLIPSFQSMRYDL